MKSKLTKSIFLIAVVSTFLVGSSGAYFSDTAVVSGNQFSTGTWDKHIVINEVYYDTGVSFFPNGNNNKSEEEGKNEWIELYNPNDIAINIKDWTITDNFYTKTINPNASIPAHGFALLSHDNDTWHFWGDPSGSNIVTINLTGSTDWLSNGGDRVILKNASGVTVDQMSYGTNTTVFNPACPDVAQGHSLTRSPLGHDTDSKNDFIDSTNPTPGA